ncbi:uncharacterized protein EV420DRAFT_1568691 [Desarmillaria tabescens]|uniref:Uncharacterized protein n=1 Tax=Armillaria tabescens TaxID=1929756 RepID=A0AA39MUT6_ARMTA|nr:uncharacterized protein EV420DRAFT_1568691 [Desarmillaria tabescens]KAK0447422.1 hypothetical protein EV420DRAFT_1568691 [Desarmillaria tabescens]
MFLHFLPSLSSSSSSPYLSSPSSPLLELSSLALALCPTSIFFVLESYVVLQASLIILRVCSVPFLPTVLLFFATF